MEAKRRRLLIATTLVGATGTTLAAVPFIQYLQPSAKAAAAGVPVTIDISKLEAGQQMVTEWRGKPVVVVHRSSQTINDLGNQHLLTQLRDPDSERTSQQPSYAKNGTRAVNPEYFVAVGLCTHLGCLPTFRPEVAPADLGKDWLGGYYCPCHGSRFDLAGRVFKNVPAPTNLVIPPYQYISDKLIIIGEDTVDA